MGLLRRWKKRRVNGTKLILTSLIEGILNLRVTAKNPNTHQLARNVEKREGMKESNVVSLLTQ